MNHKSSLEITNKYCQDFRNTKFSDIDSQIMMLPTIRKQDPLELLSPTTHRYRPGPNGIRPRTSSHGHKFDNGMEIKKKTKTDFIFNVNQALLDNNIKQQQIMEGPIDLSASNTIKTEPDIDEITNLQQIQQIQQHNERHLTIQNEMLKPEEMDERRIKLQKNKQKKKKLNLPEDNWNSENVSGERLPKQGVNKREEVLKAARSLFSKRTRTLYHWMYPDTSKGKLKSIVSSAWDTLSSTEKEFYISQVLGRFGVPAGSLMVNPQLGGFQNREVVSSSYAILASANNTSTSDIDANTCIQITPVNCEEETLMNNRSKKRSRKDLEEADKANQSNSASNAQSTQSYDDDEFADDPELTTELMQFQRAMGQTE